MKEIDSKNDIKKLKDFLDYYNKNKEEVNKVVREYAKVLKELLEIMEDELHAN
jgi:ABC-type transporter Mla subunit MlaD